MGETNPQECTDGNTPVMFYPPYPDELLSSWIIRNSIVQGSDPMGWVYGFWGEWRAWTRDIDRHLPVQRCAELSRFSRLTIEDIQEMTLTPVIDAVEGDTPDVNKAWKWVIPTGKRNRSVVSGLQFCPECLKEKEVFSPRRWRLSWHTQCEKHTVRLHDRCDRCAMPFSPHLIDYTAPHIHLCPRCGNDLRSMPTTPSPEHVLLLQKRIDGMLHIAGKFSEYFAQWKVQTTTDFFLLLRDILVLTVILSKKEERYIQWQIFLFGKKRFGRLFSKAGLSFDMRSIQEREMLLSIASHLLERTPAYLLKSLQHIRVTQAILNEQSFPNSMQIRRLLSRLPSCPAVKRMRAHKNTPRSKEPRTAEEIREQMEAIRRFL